MSLISQHSPSSSSWGVSVSALALSGSSIRLNRLRLRIAGIGFATDPVSGLPVSVRFPSVPVPRLIAGFGFELCYRLRLRVAGFPLGCRLRFRLFLPLKPLMKACRRAREVLFGHCLHCEGVMMGHILVVSEPGDGVLFSRRAPKLFACR